MMRPTYVLFVAPMAHLDIISHQYVKVLAQSALGIIQQEYVLLHVHFWQELLVIIIPPLVVAFAWNYVL